MLPTIRSKYLSTRMVAIVIALAVFAVGLGVLIRPAAKTNLLLITLDTTRADRIGCYGWQPALTPVIDRIASNGAMFENAFAVCPVTLPSHTTMFTGLMPREHGLHHNGIGTLDAKIPTLAELLRSQGYDTGAFVGAFVLNQKFGLNRGFEKYDDFTGGEFSNGQFHRRRKGQLVVDSALDWLKGRTSQPFFCWIHMFDPHAPYRPREELFGQQFTERPYDAGIAVCDHQIGRIIDYLKRNGLDKSTLIVIVGDHGEGLGEHHEREHGHMLYNSTLRVPLIVAHPLLCKPGHRVTQAVSLVDLAPTLLECLGHNRPEKLSGRSLASTLKGQSLPTRPCFAETDIPFLEHRWAPQRCLITESWKYIRSPKPELYDLHVDPAETNNLAEEQVDTIHQMESTLADLEAGQEDRRVQHVKLSAAERRSLASLGYLGNAHTKEPDGIHLDLQSLPDIKDRLKYHELVEDASHLLDLNRPVEALKILERVVEEVPEYFPARMFLGEALAKSGKIDGALELFQKLAEQEPQRGEVHARLASILGQLGRQDEALAEMQKAVDRADETAEFQISLGVIYLELNRQDKALELFERAIQIDAAGANFEIGRVLATSGDLNGAIDCYQRTLKIDPNWTHLHTEIAVLLGRQRRFEEAIIHAKRAVQANPHDADGHYNLGVMLAEQGNFKEALESFEEAARLNPHHPKVLVQLKRLQALIQARGGHSTDN